MKHEKIYKNRSDGVQVKLIVDLTIGHFNPMVRWQTTVEIRAKGKVKWMPAVDPREFQSLKYEDRPGYVAHVNVQYITPEMELEVRRELLSMIPLENGKV